MKSIGKTDKRSQTANAKIFVAKKMRGFERIGKNVIFVKKKKSHGVRRIKLIFGL